MVDGLLSLPDWLGGLVVMALTTGVGLGVYLVAYKLISKYRREDLKDPTSNLFRVVGVLVSLMLSLAFADVIVKLRAIENAVGREVVAISDTFYDLQAFDAEKTRDIRALLIDYIDAVIDDDWPALADDRLGRRSGKLKRQLVEQVVALKPATPVQEKIWALILADVDAISDHRLTRLDSALAQPPVFVEIVILGFLVTMACFGAYRPQGPLVGLISLYTLFIGFVLYLILSLSDPFQGAFGIDPTAFERLAETLREDMA